MRFKTIGAISVVATMALGLSSVQAQKSAEDCGVPPIMPEVPAAFESEEQANELAKVIGNYKVANKSYQECLNVVIDSKDDKISDDTKQEALEAFNQVGDNEAAVINRFMAAATAWNEAHKDDKASSEE